MTAATTFVSSNAAALLVGAAKIAVGIFVFLADGLDKFYLFVGNFVEGNQAWWRPEFGHRSRGVAVPLICDRRIVGRRCRGISPARQSH